MNVTKKWLHFRRDVAPGLFLSPLGYRALTMMAASRRS